TLSDAEKLKLMQGPDEEALVNSGLEDTMIEAYHEIREIWKQHDGIDMRTASFIDAIDKVAQSYMELGVFP
ncbi:MAG TPA: Glu/Leu/Phe/Val dehydrogenase, partial [Bacteroidota bacterium]|nr:Glu/Leu/Phe/Val dehydrogenase [Bacteroidota bacterium]